LNLIFLIRLFLFTRANHSKWQIVEVRGFA
jgi:hypothetical protein